MEFAERLRCAISATDLSLERLSTRLAEQGTPVSVSSLSAWQSGVSRPEKSRSLQALRQLEGILGLEDDALRGLLAARRPRGRGREPQRLMVSEWWEQPGPVERLLTSLGALADDPEEPTRLSVRAQATIDAAGHHDSLTMSTLLKAGPSGARRVMSVIRYPGLPRPPLMLDASGVRIGRFRGDPSSGFAVTELLFDPPIPPGGVHLVRHTTRLPRTPEQYLDTRAQVGCRDVVLDVRFDRSRLPASCTAYHRPSVTSDDEPLHCGAAGPASFQLALADPAPGIYGVRWRWPTDDSS